jgi:hypothetical protein
MSKLFSVVAVAVCLLAPMLVLPLVLGPGSGDTRARPWHCR